MDDLNEIVDMYAAMKPWATRIKRTCPSEIRQYTEKRLVILRSCLSPNEMNAGKLYNRASRSGYPASYKSFQRDMAVLVMQGFVCARRVYVGGNTTLYKVVS